MAGHRPDSLSTLPRATVDDEVEEVRSHEDETDEDSLSRAPTLPFGVDGGPPGGGIGRTLSGPPSAQELLRASGRPLHKPGAPPGLPSGVAPPRGPIGSERFRAPPVEEDLLNHAARAQAVLAKAEDSPLHLAGFRQRGGCCGPCCSDGS